MERAVPEKILFVLHGAIGDVVRALPLAVRVKRHWPETKLLWAIEPKSMDLLVDHPAVDELIIFQRQYGFKEFRRYLRSIQKQNVDLTLDLQRHFKSGLVSYSSYAKERIGFHRRDAKEFNWLFNNRTIPEFGESLPKIEHYQKFGDLLGLPPLERLEFGFDFREETKQLAEHQLKLACEARGVPLPERARRVALLIGGSWESKKWSVAHFVRTAKLIVEQLSALPILLGGPGDVQMAELILREVEECVSLCGKTNLRQLAYLLTQVRSAVSGDSGPMHISAAVGTPVVSLWGPTNPVRTGPYGQERYVLRTAIGCAPCYKRKCPGLNSICMEDLPPEVVMHWLRDIHSGATAVS